VTLLDVMLVAVVVAEAVVIALVVYHEGVEAGRAGGLPAKQLHVQLGKFECREALHIAAPHRIGESLTA